MQLKFKKTLTSLLILTPLVITPVILLSNSTSLNSASNPITRSAENASSYVLDETITDMWTMDNTTIAKTTNGNLYSWGYGSVGQTGQGVTTDVLTPTLLLDPSDSTNSSGAFTNLSTGETIIDAWTIGNAIIAKATNGDVFSWGFNAHGEVGIGTSENVLTPMLLLDSSTPTNSSGNFKNLPLDETIIDLWTMDNTIIAKTTNNNIYSWGWSISSQTGVGVTTDVLTPTLLLDASDPTQSKGDFENLSIGDTIIDMWTENQSSFAKTTNDDVFSWGWNNHGQTGVGGTTDVLTPTLLLDASDPTKSSGVFEFLSVDETITNIWTVTSTLIAKTTNGDVFSWGLNNYGQAGLFGTTEVLTPTLLLDFSDSSNSSGAFSTLPTNETIINAWGLISSFLVKTTNGNVYSWGNNQYGATGFDITSNEVLTPTLLLDSSDPANSRGDFISLVENETIIDAWITNNTIIAKISNGDVYSWGRNDYGQTGVKDSSTIKIDAPKLLLDASNPTQSKGDFTNLAIGETIIDAWTMDNTIIAKTLNGNIYIWGRGDKGQIGLDGTTNVLTPTLLFDGTKIAEPIVPVDPKDPVDPVDPVDPAVPEVPSVSSGGMSTGALVGIIVGSIAGVAVIGFGVWWYIKKIK